MKKVKITKFNHSCLFIEVDKNSVLFDPGGYSRGVFNINQIKKIDEVIITHIHPDHIDINLIKEIKKKFIDINITAPEEVHNLLDKEGLKYQKVASKNISYFKAPHESVAPVWPQPEQQGIHYCNVITNPGDSHSFSECKEILTLPITAPWGSAIKALNVAISLKPKYVIPLHDWHYSDEARVQIYEIFSSNLENNNIKFIKIENCVPVEVELD